MKVYTLASNCQITKGKYRSSLIDLHKEKLYIISNDFADFLAQNSFPQKSISKKYKNILKHLIKEQILILIEKDDIELFPKLSTTFETPSFINDTIIEIEDIYHSWDIIIPQLELLLCKNIELRFYNDSFRIEYLTQLAESVNKSIIECIDIYLPFSSYQANRKNIKKLISTNIRFKTLFVYSSNGKSYKNDNKCFFTNQKIDSNKHCGKINEFNFIINSLVYFESLSKNTCLNKKVSIDKNGEIKNCPSMSKSFGNINNKSISSVLDNNFKKYWDIKKDSIQDCNICEFRNICTDCRAYISKPNDIYSKPLKCGYDLKLGTWGRWSENPLKLDAINYYELTDI